MAVGAQKWSHIGVEQKKNSLSFSGFLLFLSYFHSNLHTLPHSGLFSVPTLFFFFINPLTVLSHLSITHWPTVLVTFLRRMEVDRAEGECAYDYMFVCQCHSFACAYLLVRIVTDACVCLCGLIVLLLWLLSSHHLTGWLIAVLYVNALFWIQCVGCQLPC